MIAIDIFMYIVIFITIAYIILSIISFILKEYLIYLKLKSAESNKLTNVNENDGANDSDQQSSSHTEV